VPSFVVVTTSAREQLVPYAELAVASGEKLVAEKEEAMDEAYTLAGTDIQTATAVTLDVHLVSVLDRPGAALDSPSSAVAGASVSPAVRFRWQQQAEAPAYTPPSASRFEWSQQEPNRLRLIRAVG
jgi:hypothetical protein